MTVLTVAHRIRAIIEYDKILGLSNSIISEFALRPELVKKPDSLLNHRLDEFYHEIMIILHNSPASNT